MIIIDNNWVNRKCKKKRTWAWETERKTEKEKQRERQRETERKKKILINSVRIGAKEVITHCGLSWSRSDHQSNFTLFNSPVYRSEVWWVNSKLSRCNNFIPLDGKKWTKSPNETMRSRRIADERYFGRVFMADFFWFGKKFEFTTRIFVFEHRCHNVSLDEWCYGWRCPFLQNSVDSVRNSMWWKWWVNFAWRILWYKWTNDMSNAWLILSLIIDVNWILQLAWMIDRTLFSLQIIENVSSQCSNLSFVSLGSKKSGPIRLVKEASEQVESLNGVAINDSSINSSATMESVCTELQTKPHLLQVLVIGVLLVKFNHYI